MDIVEDIVGHRSRNGQFSSEDFDVQRGWGQWVATATWGDVRVRGATDCGRPRNGSSPGVDVLFPSRPHQHSWRTDHRRSRDDDDIDWT